MFETKDGYKLKLQTMKLSGSKKNILHNIKNRKLSSFEVVELVLVQCNLAGNQYQQNSEPHILSFPINLMLICLTLNQAI